MTLLPPIKQTASDRDRLWLGLAAGVVGLILLALWLAPLRINHDCAALLMLGELLLDGAMPYRDFADMNPPLITYLNTVPAMLGRMLGVSPIVVFHLLVVALLVVSGLQIHGLLKRRRMGLSASGRGLILLAWLLSYCIVDLHGDAGQREHLFMLLYAPYLFLRILRHRGGEVSGWYAVLLGVQAGIGASIKPHFLVAAAAVELALLIRSRRWQTLVRPENFALASFVAAYVAHWAFVPAAMREAYFGRWVPLTCQGYHSYDMSCRRLLRTIFGSTASMTAIAAALLAALQLTRRPRRLSHLLLALAALTAMGFALVVVQYKGWSYHRIPLDVAGLLCLAAVVASRIRPPTPSVGQWIIGGLMIVCLLTVWLRDREKARAETPGVAMLRELVVAHTRPKDRVLFVTTSVLPTFPMLAQIDRRPGSRYMCMFSIAFFYAGSEKADYHRWDEASAEERQYLDDLREDVERLQPRLILVLDRDGSPHSRNATGSAAKQAIVHQSGHDRASVSGWDRPRVDPSRCNPRSRTRSGESADEACRASSARPFQPVADRETREPSRRSNQAIRRLR